MEEEYQSYPKIRALGSKYAKGALDGPVIVEEKVDGSQFSFGCIGGELQAWSKRRKIDMDKPDGMFALGAAVVRRVGPLLRIGYTYRGEYLQKPRHNVLVYNKVPKNHILIFDILDSDGSYLSREEKETEASAIGLRCVPLLFEGLVESGAHLAKLLDTTSVLGGPKIEGLVIKRDKGDRSNSAKYVSAAFKEVHRSKINSPPREKIGALLGEQYRSEARWDKAIQHLKEDGKLEGEPKDIGLLVREVQADILSEHEEEIKAALLQYAWTSIKKGAVSGLPEYYKQHLAESTFEQ